ncbi:MAG: YbaB/EbfC family nucleoid-associated protein [Verrucomicrobium sp.]|jgi:DNA-binding YbaB/EbfC family protein|nr:YbaB/EbfC family nucleoid-associated protein [Verrucomicrobium sp.]
MSSVGKLMRQAQRIQQQMEAVQASIAQKTVETSSGGGAVKVVVSGDGQVKSVRINPDAVNKDDVAFLEDLILSAVNQGLEQAKELSNKEMGAVTQGFGLPGMF